MVASKFTSHCKSEFCYKMYVFGTVLNIMVYVLSKQYCKVYLGSNVKEILKSCIQFVPNGQSADSEMHSDTF